MRLSGALGAGRVPQLGAESQAPSAVTHLPTIAEVFFDEEGGGIEYQFKDAEGENSADLATADTA